MKKKGKIFKCIGKKKDGKEKKGIRNEFQKEMNFMQDVPEAAWSIPYVSEAFFPSLKHNFIAYRFIVLLHIRLHFWNAPAVTIRL